MAKDLDYKVNDVIVSYDPNFLPAEHYGGVWQLIGGNGLIIPTKDESKLGRYFTSSKHKHKITHRWLISRNFAVTPDSTRWGFAEYNKDNTPQFKSPSKMSLGYSSRQNYTSSTSSEKFAHTVTGETRKQENDEIRLLDRVFCGFWLKVV